MYKLISLIVIFIVFAPEPKSVPQDSSFDLLILDARIIDGSGSDAYTADILINEGIIIEIGDLDPQAIQVETIIDAEGRVATPGFIDTHSHGNPLQTPEFRNFLAMGVTTIALGQDGRSVQTDDLKHWMDQVDQVNPGPNILHFQGHATLRNLVNAPMENDLDPMLIREMKNLMKKAMEQGAFGLTTGLEYEPGSFADVTELVEIAKPVSEYHGIVMSHMRSEDDHRIEDSIKELLYQGHEADVDVHISHLKIVYANDPSRAEEILELMELGRKEGINVTADVYPYTASYTGISIVFPDWARPPHNYDEVVKNRRPELAGYLRNRIEMRNGPQATLFGTDPWTGMTLAEVADSLDKPFEDFLIEDIGPGGASAAYFVMNEEVMKRFLQDPHVMISSDGSPTMQHPRGYGSFAKIIRKYVHKENLLMLEEAIHKMSGLPASALGLDDADQVNIPRGYIRKGYAADLLLFYPDKVRDLATFEEPHKLAEGFDWVIVNGAPAIVEGEFRDIGNGRVVRKNIRD